LENKQWHQKQSITWLLIVLFFPLGLILLWKNKFYSKKVNGIITTIFLIIAISGMSSGSDDTQNQITADDDEPKQSQKSEDNEEAKSKTTTKNDEEKNKTTKASTKPKEEKKEEPKQESKWYEQPLSKDIVKAALKDINGLKAIELTDKTVKEGKIIDNAGNETKNDKIVELGITPDTFWNETDYAEMMGATIISYSEQLFKNNNVSQVRIIGYTAFTDEYGNEEEEAAVRISWDKETAQKVDYENFYDLVLTDYTRSYKLANNYYIHPAIHKNLNNADGLYVSGP